MRPAGKSIGEFGDLVLNLIPSPNGRVLIAVHAGFQPHGLEVFDTMTHKHVQHIPLTSAWRGIAWSADGHTLYVAGGNASGIFSRKDPVAPVYQFSYKDGRLTDQPTGRLVEKQDPKSVWWSGLAYLNSRHWLYAVNRGTGTEPGNVVVFDTRTGKIVTRIPVEVTPYGTTLSHDGKRLFVSTWSSHSVSVIDTTTNTVERTVQVGLNPNDLKLSGDGRLFVACSNGNSVYAIDTRTLRVLEDSLRPRRQTRPKVPRRTRWQSMRNASCFI